MIGKTNSRQATGMATEFVNVQLSTNQSSHQDLLGAKVILSYGSLNKEYVWDGSDITIAVPALVNYTISFGEVEGYRTPSSMTFEAVMDNARTIEAVYETEVVSVDLSSSNGSSLDGAVITINGKEHTWKGTTLVQKVPYGTVYSVIAGELSGYTTPSALTDITANSPSRSLSFSYVASGVVVNILSNQENDTVISGVKAQVFKRTPNPEDAENNAWLYELLGEVNNGEIINIPSDIVVVIQFPEVEGYKKPNDIILNYEGGVVEESGTYQTQLLTVNVAGSGATPSGYTITGKDSSTGEVLFTQTASAATHKIPWDVQYTVSASSLTGYASVSNATGTANALTNAITMTYVWDPVTDLSKQDIYGNAISQTTANCYVIKQTGQYKFPLVYGNALKNGSVNSAAYTKNSGSNSHDFVSHDGTKVTTPYIETLEGSAASAQLSIADTDGIFTDISIVDGSPCRYVQFSVASIPATGANGVISIKNSSGIIMWNWHIWVWPDDLSVVEITNATNVKYNILPVNLGSKWDDTAKTKIKNWFYQFGRPTPLLCPSAYNSTSNHASYGALSFTTASIALYLYNGIQKPTTFYRYDSNYNNKNWFKDQSTKVYNLWDAACTTTGNSDNDVVKTVYDPCPIGFKVPNGNTFTYFSKSNVVGSFANGWKFKRYEGDTVGVFFPASGYRFYSNGSLFSVGSGGFVWLSSAYSVDYAYDLHFISGQVTPQRHQHRALGYSVRPVQE